MTGSKLKGRTWEETMGVEAAKKRRLDAKAKTWDDIYGVEKADKLRADITKRQKGKSIVEQFGKEKAAEIMKKLRKKKGKYNLKIIRKGKTWEEMFGKESAEKFKQKCRDRQKALKPKRVEINKKISENKTIKKDFIMKEFKKRFNNKLFIKNDWCKYMKDVCSRDAIRRKFGSLDNLAKLCDVKFPKAILPKKSFKSRKKLSKSLRNMNPILRKEVNEKLRKARTIKKELIIKTFIERFHKRPFFKTEWDLFMGDICCDDTVINKFKSLDLFAELCGVKFPVPQSDKYGKNETEILDMIEKQKNIKIERQYSVCRYFVDGYDVENNVVYEVDEDYHKIQQVEDAIRENKIKLELDCVFIRINEQNFLTSQKYKNLESVWE